MLNFFRTGVYAFVSWVIVLGLLALAMDWPRGVFIAFHYLAIILIFGYAFYFFYKTHSNTSAYITTIATLIWLFLFESLYGNFFSSDAGRFLNYIDWIFPAFLIATTVYGVKKKLA